MGVIDHGECHSVLKFTLALILVFGAGHASAQSCPDFYRFVDFGLPDSTGALHRGGPVFRAEGFTGDALLVDAMTECLPITDVARDGRGNAIPVVSAIGYDPENAGLSLTELRVRALPDTYEAAARNGRAHRAALLRAGVATRTGPTFLCADGESADTASCQVVSPFDDDIDLFVYCDATECTMPVMAINRRLAVSAAWVRDERDLSDLGESVSGKVLRIQAFLSPLASGI
jgi:hypothetical protein